MVGLHEMNDVLLNGLPQDCGWHKYHTGLKVPNQLPIT